VRRQKFMANGSDLLSLNQWASNFSIEELLKGNLDAFIALFYLIIMIAIYTIVIYHFYRYIARRDCFKPSARKHSKAVGFIKYFFLYPFVAMIFFLGFSLIFISLTDPNTYEVIQILPIAFAIIVAIRITAYYTEDLSKDVAKMLPFAVLGIFLVDSTYFEMGIVISRISSLPEYVNTIVQFLILIILVEWILRIALNIRYLILPKREPSDVKES
jgi:hypothetical protein